MTEAYFQEGFHLTPRFGAAREMLSRVPGSAESAVIDKARQVFARTSLKAIALLDGDHVLWSAYKEPSHPATRFSGYSLGKTVTAMTVGHAICDGKLKPTTEVPELVPELRGTGYDKVTVAHLLTMSSGIRDGSYHAAGTPQVQEKIRQIHAGQGQWRDLLPLVNQRRVGFFGKALEPGESFEYKEMDAFVLGLMVEAAAGQPLSTYMEERVLPAIGIEGPVALRQDKSRTTYAPTVARMTLPDWTRFAAWVKKQEGQPGCIGDFVRAATRTQIANKSNVGFSLHHGYGHFVWTDNPRHRDSYWAWGFGGQRIAWNRSNARMLVVFSSLENNAEEVFDLYREWAALP
ncbi:beta-lactamase family protein [Ramlibacter sp. AW1]|uniref:Beta-lactamase family protein n=1 Tax=Ramlibacter aurantiacus TaxID=2801330 RepID=A0A936ZT85_9BURK|nr:serine hydrolase domain-containing protein [Ramlibacter aurantiacus]MBL0423048.1 beta-lactamase family protein [Ramlibacter aurantiacus]